MDPAGKVAIITGGNSGLGAGAARRLVELGAHVVCLDRAGDPPDGATFLACDVTDTAQVRDAVANVVERHGQVDILLNNAGIGGLGAIATADGPGDVEAFASVIAVNLLGAVRVAAEVAHRMIGNAPGGPDGERGVIVNTCSIASYGGQEGMGAYTAAKAALKELTLVWARDLSRHGIRVNGVAPGFMATPMVAGLPPPFVDQLLADAEFPKRAGTPEDFAAVIEFLVRMSLVNGEVLRLDAATRPPARTTWGSGQPT